MALASTTACNQALDGLSGGTTNVLAYTSLHTASPSTTGGSEATGGSYARQACTWNAAASGAKTNSSSLTFSTAGTTAMTHFGTFSALTAGTYGVGGALTASVTAATITIAPAALSINLA